MTRILTGALRNRNGVRVCPRGCTGVDRGPGVATGCLATKRKTVGPGVTEYTPPLPGMCSMFYNPDTKEPT
jgi:hypothetical protein